GKDEAYYFLDAPKGPIPYTHVGLVPGTTRHVLARAVAAGGGRVLELSPVIHQRIGAGISVPRGVPHRPGTALTLEVQEPSDVYTMLERESGARTLTSREMHPGFTSVDQALAFVDFKTAGDPSLPTRCYLRPERVRGRRSRGGRPEWIFPPRSRKFRGQRLFVLRLAVGTTFIVHGYPKLFPSGTAGFAGFLQNLGFPIPGTFAWIVSIVEFFGGMAMILGLLVRYVGALMTIEMVVTSTKVKMAHGTGFVGARGAGWELDFLLLAIALALLLAGAGAFSLDAVLWDRRAPGSTRPSQAV